MRPVPNANPREEHIWRALNKIRIRPKKSRDVLNRDLGPGDPPFQVREVSAWLRNALQNVLNLYWLKTRPRK
jgi:hypothetical protein